MNKLPYTLYRAAEARELDRIAIEQFGISGLELMNRAGGAAFDELCNRWPEARRIVVVCGAGNNAGDGYVVARLASEKGFKASIMALADPAELKGGAKTALGAAKAAGLTVSEFDAQSLSKADIIVDAIFGTGLDRPVEGHWAAAIDAINASGTPVLALDIPSGLHADSGMVLGHAVMADVTVSFIALKQGLFTAAGVDYCGEVCFDDLDVESGVYRDVPVACERIDWLKLRASLPKRPRSAHKGMFGHVLVIGGNHGMAGAARMAAEAALRCGSGLTSVATRKEHAAAMAAARPEVMWHGVEEGTQLRHVMRRATVIAIGPGLGQDEWAAEMFAAALESGLPLVVDADALNLLAEEPCQRGNWIVTPHPGEAARLLGLSASEVNQQRFDVVKALSVKFDAFAVLKGAGTLVSDREGHFSLCSGGNPGMASGGMGDVLTGIIAALLAQGLGMGEAARCGVALHAAAADKMAVAGVRGMTAGDLIVTLRGLVN
jgi:hydroxyethylthiazole kinase-like uncharacterized protein yjeF